MFDLNNKSNRFQFLIQFGYIGHNFYGVQRQRGLPTVGEALFQRLQSAANCAPKALTFAARTDRGVHAHHNIATCWFEKIDDEQLFLEEMQRPLADGITSLTIERVPYTVHARGMSQGKHYRYVFQDRCEEVHEPKDNFTWQVLPFLNIEAMQTATRYLLGEHDFSAFKSGPHTGVSRIKNISQIEVNTHKLSFPRDEINDSNNKNLIHLDIWGDAFLRQMVRNIAGLLAEVGAGLRDPHSVKDIIESKNRSHKSITAPACGLTLIRVGFSWPILHHDQQISEQYFVQ